MSSGGWNPGLAHTQMLIGCHEGKPCQASKAFQGLKQARSVCQGKAEEPPQRVGDLTGVFEALLTKKMKEEVR